MDNYPIINIYIAKVVVFAGVSFTRFIFHRVTRQKIKLQSQKGWSVKSKNQISAPNRLKNGTYKIMVGKTSISVLNTVDIGPISPLLAKFGLRSRY